MTRERFRVGVPMQGHWDEVLNTDSDLYGGGNRGNLGGVQTGDVACDGHAASIEITLPPLSTLVLTLRKTA